MSYNKYQISDIRIGDEVYFDSTDERHNQNEYWIVKEIHPETNELYISTPPTIQRTEYHTIHISEVRARLPVTKKKTELMHDTEHDTDIKKAS